MISAAAPFKCFVNLNVLGAMNACARCALGRSASGTDFATPPMEVFGRAISEQRPTASLIVSGMKPSHSRRYGC
jgi:hypothetical protein